MKKILVLLALISLNAKTAINTVKDTPANVKNTQNESTMTEWWNNLKKKAQDIYQDLMSKKPQTQNKVNQTDKNNKDNDHYNCTIGLGVGGVVDLESEDKFNCPGIKTKIQENADKSSDLRDKNVSAMESD